MDAEVRQWMGLGLGMAILLAQIGTSVGLSIWGFRLGKREPRGEVGMWLALGSLASFLGGWCISAGGSIAASGGAVEAGRDTFMVMMALFCGGCGLSLFLNVASLVTLVIAHGAASKAVSR